MLISWLKRLRKKSKNCLSNENLVKIKISKVNNVVNYIVATIVIVAIAIVDRFNFTFFYYIFESIYFILSTFLARICFNISFFFLFLSFFVFISKFFVTSVSIVIAWVSITITSTKRKRRVFSRISNLLLNFLQLLLILIAKNVVYVVDSTSITLLSTRFQLEILRIRSQSL